ncbi:hypothetical protein [Sorangium sp. So ce1151]|uniref:hypothetical protein n=1 Tax=Sorangium sp. So ce1151 TaxID=3133332 RepID=UPI003F5EADAB
MKTIQTILLCAPFLGLFAVALPGCPGDPSGQESEAQPSAEPGEVEPQAQPQTDVICDKLAECGDLRESVTAEQCAARLDSTFRSPLQDDLCGPVLREVESLMGCTAQHASCEEFMGDEGDDLPEDHPCYEENESLKKALDETNEQGDSVGLGCLFIVAIAMQDATNPATGTECTWARECPEVRCSGEGGPVRACSNGWCVTEEDVCP